MTGIAKPAGRTSHEFGIVLANFPCQHTSIFVIVVLAFGSRGGNGFRKYEPYSL
jgi:hypothetical protein